MPGAGVLPSGGCASRLVVVSPVWWWCLVPRQHIAAGHPGGYARQLLSAAAVSRLNQSCRVRLIDTITLIINYLGAPFGCAFK